MEVVIRGGQGQCGCMEGWPALAGVSAAERSLTVTHPEGDVMGKTYSDWLETPHLYRRGRLIVIPGDPPDVLDALDAVLELR
jgi:hypothetical protein